MVADSTSKRQGSTSRPGIAPGRDPRVDGVLNVLEPDLLTQGLSGWSDRPPKAGDAFAQVDTIVALPGEANRPGEMFDRLRWGGRMIVVANRRADILELAKSYDATNTTGFVLEQPVKSVRPANVAGWQFWKREKAWYFIARKTHIVRPNEFSSRFTYDVSLVPSKHDRGAYVVRKVIPARQRVIRNLQHKFPQVTLAELERRAHKLCDEVFPVFLTREARFLMMLQDKMPERFKNRVPTPLGVEKGERQLVTRLDMSWLRMGRETMSQLDFAMQTAEILQALHEHVGLMHLDLRLDNIVISENGVALVDFGSAAREGEDLSRNPLLKSLFSEIMQTSEIQRVLKHMVETGHVTSQSLLGIRGIADKRLDTFYLAVQMSRPTTNPDIAQLVDYDPNSDEAHYISQLTARVLRPQHGDDYQTAAALLDGLKRIHKKLQTHESAVEPVAVG